MVTKIIDEIIAKLREDMAASPVDDVTVIDRGQLDALSAALAAAEQPVRIKPLEWEGATARTCFGGYHIEDHAGYNRPHRYRLRLPSGAEGYSVLSHSAPEYWFDDHSPAKQCAQQDFEARIRSALAIPPAMEEFAAAIRALAEDNA